MRPDIAYVYYKLKQLRFEFKEGDRKLFPKDYRFDYGLDRYVRVDGNDLYISKDTFKPLEEELEYADRCHNLEENKTNNCSIVSLFDSLKNGIYELRDGKMIHRVVRGIEENGLCVVSEFCKYPECDEKFYYQEHNIKWFFKEDRSE